MQVSHAASTEEGFAAEVDQQVADRSPAAATPARVDLVDPEGHLIRRAISGRKRTSVAVESDAGIRSSRARVAYISQKTACPRARGGISRDRSSAPRLAGAELGRPVSAVPPQIRARHPVPRFLERRHRGPGHRSLEHLDAVNADCDRSIEVDEPIVEKKRDFARPAGGHVDAIRRARRLAEPCRVSDSIHRTRRETGTMPGWGTRTTSRGYTGAAARRATSTSS